MTVANWYLWMIFHRLLENLQIFKFLPILYIWVHVADYLEGLKSTDENRNDDIFGKVVFVTSHS